MPGSFSNYAENKLLDHLFGGNQMAVPSLYMGYFLTGCDDNGPGAEPNGNGYARVAVGPDFWQSSTAQLTTNIQDIVCPRSTGEQGNVVGIGLFDSSVGGNFLSYFPAEDAVLIQKRDSLVVLNGGLVHQFLPGGLTNYVKNGILNHIYKAIPLPVFPVVHAGYMTSAPSDAAAGAEPGSGGYLRVPMPNNGVSWAPTGGGVKENAVAIEWPVTTAAQGTATHLGFWTADTGGQFLAYGPLDPVRNMVLNSQLIINPGDIKITLD